MDTIPSPIPIKPLTERAVGGNNWSTRLRQTRVWQVVRHSILLLIPVGIGIAWSVYPVLTGYLAAEEFHKSPLALQIRQNQWSETMERKVQKFFLDRGLYIPMEDIVINKENHISDKSPFFQMRKACGQGKLYVWIPLRIRVPLFGEKVVEWCFKQS